MNVSEPQTGPQSRCDAAWHQAPTRMLGVGVDGTLEDSLRCQGSLTDLNIDKGLQFRMGLSFWSDRSFQSNEMTASQYHCAIPLTYLTSLTTNLIESAFGTISTMYGGGDGPEDLLLGIVFSRTDPKMNWLPDSVKQIHFFTDNPFHYYGDGTATGRNGGSIPPLSKWTTQPSNLYRYYDKTRLFT